MLADLPKKSNDNACKVQVRRSGDDLPNVPQNELHTSTGTVATPYGPMTVKTWPYKVHKLNWQRRKIWVHCKACSYRWVLCWAPVPVSKLSMFQTDCCPSCHTEGQVFMGKPRGIIRAFLDGFKSGVTHGNH